jgi:hypothetical protein
MPVVPSRGRLALLVLFLGVIALVALRRGVESGDPSPPVGAEHADAAPNSEQMAPSGLASGHTHPTERIVVVGFDQATATDPLIAPPGGLLVRVVGEDGRPRAGVPVAIVLELPEGEHGSVIRATTRAPDGLAVLETDLRSKLPPAGSRFSAELFLPLEPRVGQALEGWIPGEPWSGGTIELVLPALAEPWIAPLCVLVLDADGAPVAKAEVELVARDREDSASSQALDRGLTSSDGRAQLSRASWLEQIESARMNRVPFDPVLRCPGPFTVLPEVALGASVGLEPVVLRLPPTGIVEARLRRADGTEIESGASVSLTWEDTSQTELGQRRAELRAGVARFPEIGLGVETFLVATLDDEAALAPRIRCPAPMRAGQVVTVELAFGNEHPRLCGRMVDENGTPAARLFFSAAGRRQRTDADGRFAIAWFSETNRGKEMVRFDERVDPEVGSFPGWVPRFGEARFPPSRGRRFELGDVVLHEVPVVLAGRVVDVDGRPVGEAAISIERSTPKEGDRSEKPAGAPSVRWDSLVLPEGSRTLTGEDGRFEIRSLETSIGLRVYATKGSELRSKQLEVAPGTLDVELALREEERKEIPRGRVVGGVRIEENVPWRWIEVSLVQEFGNGSSSAESVSPIAGRFAFEYVDPGNYRLEVNTASVSAPLVSIEDVVVVAGETNRDRRLERIDLTGRTRMWRLLVQDKGAPLARRPLQFRYLGKSSSCKTTAEGRLLFLAPIELERVTLGDDELGELEVTWSPVEQSVAFRRD